MHNFSKRSILEKQMKQDSKPNPKLLMIIFFLLLLAILASLIFSFPPLVGNNGLLRVCKFNERDGKYDVCFWRWDHTLSQPSIYF